MLCHVIYKESYESSVLYNSVSDDSFVSEVDVGVRGSSGPKASDSNPVALSATQVVHIHQVPLLILVAIAGIKLCICFSFFSDPKKENENSNTD